MKVKTKRRKKTKTTTRDTNNYITKVKILLQIDAIIICTMICLRLRKSYNVNTVTKAS